MPTVEATVAIAAPVERVYALARAVEDFPGFMNDVESVQLLEQDGPRQLVRWVGVIKEFNRKMRWTEEDVWDEEHYICEFRQTEGDFSLYRGRWELRPTAGGTEFYCLVEYDYQVPLIGALIRSIVHRKMQENIESMLAGFKAAAERG